MEKYSRDPKNRGVSALTAQKPAEQQQLNQWSVFVSKVCGNKFDQEHNERSNYYWRVRRSWCLTCAGVAQLLRTRAHIWSRRIPSGQ